MIDVEYADQLIEQYPIKPSTTTVDLSLSHGCCLAQDIVSTREQPPFDRVAMDGFAVAWDGSGKFVVKGRQMAGSPPLSLQDSSHAIEVGTGAMLPKGTDTVIPYERTVIGDGVFELKKDTVVHKAQNIHFRGSDYKKGEMLLSRGIQLTAPHIAIIASQGMNEVSVFSYPNIAIISTGNELIAPGGPCKAWQIWQSNAHAICAELLNWGVPKSDVKMFHLSDNPDDIFTGLSSILQSFQLIVLSGGVSKGKFDFIPKILGDLYVHKIFHWIKQKPGKPMYFGSGEHGQAVFGLPGNPVSALFCLRRYIIPFVHKSIGKKVSHKIAFLGDDVLFKKELTLFQAVGVKSDEMGRFIAHPLPSNGSGDFASLAQSAGFLELPAGDAIHKKGNAYPFFPWGGALT